MNLSETDSEARNRFEMQLGELGIPAKFVDEIIGHHTPVNYNKGSMIFLQKLASRPSVLGLHGPGQGLLSALRRDANHGQARGPRRSHRSR